MRLEQLLVPCPSFPESPRHLWISDRLNRDRMEERGRGLEYWGRGPCGKGILSFGVRVALVGNMYAEPHRPEFKSRLPGCGGRGTEAQLLPQGSQCSEVAGSCGDRHEAQRNKGAR